MSRSENGKQPVTWDMIAEKLDKELESTKSYAPPIGTEHLLPYFKVAAAYIHRHLKDRQVPAELYEAVFSRKNIFGEIAHRWMDEAKLRDGDTRDKDDVAAISVETWLKQVLREKREAALKELRLDERTLIYSEVELDADGETTSFMTGGMPDTYNIEDIDQYREFAEGLSADTAIFVTVNSWSVGNGESENAGDEEVELIEANRDYLDMVFGIDHLQTAEFTEYVQDEAFDYDDDEPDNGLEP